MSTKTLGKSGVQVSQSLLNDPLLSGNAAGVAENFTSGAETEVEDVEGFNLMTTAEFDREISSLSKESGNEAVESVLEETGSSVALDEDEEPLDALYASYPGLIPEAKAQVAEVIIGTDNRVRINPTTSYPWQAICALKITAKNGTKWIGTGYLISARTVITAGHCVFLHGQGGWAKSIEVIPAMNDALRPFQSASSANLRSVVGWTQNKNRENDYGAIILPSNYRPGDRTGFFGFGVKDDAYLKASVLNLSGYPGDKGGNQQWFMALKPKALSSRVIYYDIDTMGGQSGAPVWIKVGSVRTCVGIHTNGHTSGNSATRIVTAVFNNLQAWKNQGL